MKLLTPSHLLFIFFIFSSLLCTSCSKDSDLFAEAILEDPEPELIENADSDENGGEEENEPPGPSSKNDIGTVLIDTTFDEVGLWDLENGSTIENGVMTLFADGGTSVRYSNILEENYYKTRRYRITFDARQTSGNGLFEFKQSNSISFQQVITSDFVTYSFEVDGNAANSENDINFRGLISGDVFEVDNFKMEIIGETSNPNVPGRPAQITFFSDFEDSTYGYSQFGVSGSQPTEINQWEIDNGTPRTSAHPEADVTTGRDGTGTSVWLGVYNEDPTRNEVFRDIALSFGESWVGYSFYVQDTIGKDRIWMQYRTLAPLGSGTVNPVTIRQSSQSGKLDIGTSTDSNFVDQTKTSLGYWNGAGTNTEIVTVDYNYRGWNDVVIHFKGGFGAGYNGPEVGPNGENISQLFETFGRDPKSDGLVEVWLNGVKVVDKVGTTLYRYNNRGGQIRLGITPKIGPYWGGPVNFAVGGNGYFDNYSIWSGPNGTYEDVDPSR